MTDAERLASRRSGILGSITDAVGGTPIVRLPNLSQRTGVEVLAKLEFLNPGGSMKDRVLTRMADEAEEGGALRPGTTILDSSSGNLAIAMAMIGATRGYRVVCVVDSKLTDVARDLIVALGAELEFVTVPDASGAFLRSRLARRAELLTEIPNVWCPDQYNNPACVRAHYFGTGMEIVEAVDGRLDVLVVTTGTGGTVSGAGKAIKEHLPGARVVAIDAVGSKIFDDGTSPRLQKGLGSALSSDELGILDLSVIDEVRLVSDQQAFTAARALARNEGILAGGSSGSAIFGALTVCADLPPGARMVVVLPDRLERYLTEHHSDEWMTDHGFEIETTMDDLWRRVEAWREEATVSVGPRDIPVRMSRVPGYVPGRRPVESATTPS